MPAYPDEPKQTDFGKDPFQQHLFHRAIQANRDAHDAHFPEPDSHRVTAPLRGLPPAPRSPELWRRCGAQVHRAGAVCVVFKACSHYVGVFGAGVQHSVMLAQRNQHY